MKSRGMYETPGGTILLAAHRAIESITLDRGAAHLKDELMPKYAELIYNGFWFSPEREMLQVLIDKSQEMVAGRVRLKLYKGGVHVIGRDSPHSLYDQDLVTFEEGAVAYDHQDAGWVHQAQCAAPADAGEAEEEGGEGMTPQRRARFGFAFLAVLALSGAPARADDSTATLGAGGLVLEKTDKIALVSEDLYLSPTAVKVSYRFRNLTNADIETNVAFPMPDVTGSVDMTVAMPDPAKTISSASSRAWMESQVDSQVEQRAFLTAEGKPEVEITERLKSLGVPLVPTLDAAGAALLALSEPQRKALVDAEIVYADEVDEGKGRPYGACPALDAPLEVLAQASLPGGTGPSCRADLHAGDRQPIDFELRRAGPQRGASVALSRDLLHGRPLHERGPVPLPQGQRAQCQARSLRRIFVLRHHVRRELGGADRNLPPCHRQGRYDAGLVLRRRREEDRADDLRDDREGLYAQARHRRAFHQDVLNR